MHSYPPGGYATERSSDDTGKSTVAVDSSLSSPSIVHWVKKLSGSSIAIEEEDTRLKIDYEEAEEERQWTQPLGDYLGKAIHAFIYIYLCVCLCSMTMTMRT